LTFYEIITFHSPVDKTEIFNRALFVPLSFKGFEPQLSSPF